MEIRIRGVSKETTYRIDGLAKKKKISRNQFLKTQIELLAIAPQLKEQENNYQTFLKQVLDFIAYQTDVIEKLVEKNNYVLKKISTDIMSVNPKEEKNNV